MHDTIITWRDSISIFPRRKTAKPAGEHPPFSATPLVNLDAATVERLISSATDSRDRLLILLIADVGLTLSEIATVGPDTVDVDSGTFTSISGEIPVKMISLRTWSLLEPYVRFGGTLDLHRASIYRIVQATGARAGLNITASQLGKYGRAYRIKQLAARSRSRK